MAAGTDLSFGDRGLGDCKLLKARAEAYGYEVKIIDKVLEDGEEISSTVSVRQWKQERCKRQQDCSARPMR